MKFLVDNQLPAALARFLASPGWIASTSLTLIWQRLQIPKSGITPPLAIAL